jgi:four helix bundle protein
LRRSGASIPTNIAEGCGRDGERELSRVLSIAAGFASESEHHVLLALDREYLTRATHDDVYTRVVEVKKMLTALHRKVTADGG